KPGSSSNAKRKSHRCRPWFHQWNLSSTTQSDPSGDHSNPGAPVRNCQTRHVWPGTLYYASALGLRKKIISTSSEHDKSIPARFDDGWIVELAGACESHGD